MKRAVAGVLFLVACGGSDNDNNNGTVDASGSGGTHDAAIDAPHQSGDYFTIPMTTPDGTFWGPKVTIGGTQFVMDLDTGSTTIGVAGSTCTQCTGVSPLYTPGAGATDAMKTSQTQYADNSGWSGEIYDDVVGFGVGDATINLALVDITKQTQFFDGNVYQGIFGLGDTRNAEPNTDAYMNKQVAANAFKNVMAFEMCGMNDGQGTGTMWLGGFDASKASAAPVYTPLIAITNNQPFYAVDITAMSIGATSVGTGAAAFQEPVVDTGTTYFYLPTTIFKATTNAIKGSSGYTTLFGTSALKEDGCVTGTNVTAAMVDAMLPPMTITMPGVNGGPNVVINAPPMQSYFYDGGNGQFCYALGDGGTQDATTMGDAIMRNFVTVIDIGNNQVGWAPDSGCGPAPAARSTTAHKMTHPHPPKRHHRV
ncbi:MAG: pepsin-like aspartic protease [Kofleriaceae bacterium]